MLITEHKVNIFKVKEYWFCHNPVDVSDCDSVIFRGCTSKNAKEGFNCTEFNTLTLDLKHPLIDIWKGFSKKSCQYEIKRAYREDIQFDIPLKDTCYSHMFHKLNESFRNKKGLSKSLNYDYTCQYCTLFVATKGYKVIAGQLYLEDRDNIRWLIGASNRLESNNHLIGSANRALIWEVITYAKSKGIKEFDFGGYHTGDNPELKAINFFKQSFGGTLVTRYDYSKNYSKLYTIAQKVKRLVTSASTKNK